MTYDGVNMLKLIEPYTEMERAGEWHGKCPFCERAGSFWVSPARQVYHCWKCGEGGDAVTFVRKLHGLSYGAAISYLARVFPDEE